MAASQGTTDSESTARLLKAILLILLDSRNTPDESTKPEILLHRAGLTHKEIAFLLGKKEDAVQKAIQRAK